MITLPTRTRVIPKRPAVPRIPCELLKKHCIISLSVHVTICLRPMVLYTACGLSGYFSFETDVLNM